MLQFALLHSTTPTFQQCRGATSSLKCLSLLMKPSDLFLHPSSVSWVFSPELLCSLVMCLWLTCQCFSLTERFALLIFSHWQKISGNRKQMAIGTQPGLKLTHHHLKKLWLAVLSSYFTLCPITKAIWVYFTTGLLSAKKPSSPKLSSINCFSHRRLKDKKISISKWASIHKSQESRKIKHPVQCIYLAESFHFQASCVQD